jgi:hypothetical protein
LTYFTEDVKITLPWLGLETLDYDNGVYHSEDGVKIWKTLYGASYHL